MKHITLSLVLGLALAACGKGGDLADRAAAEADAACKCADFECTKAHVAELNKMSIKEGDAAKALAADRAKIYADAQRRAGDCQEKLRPHP
jgi:hypothetical protein